MVATTLGIMFVRDPDEYVVWYCFDIHTDEWRNMLKKVEMVNAEKSSTQSKLDEIVLQDSSVKVCNLLVSGCCSVHVHEFGMSISMSVLSVSMCSLGVGGIDISAIQLLVLHQ